MPPKKRQADSAPAPDAGVVLKPIKALRAKMGPKASQKKTLEEVGLGGKNIEVRAMDSDGVTGAIEAICVRAVSSILRGEGFSYHMPSRAASNQLYIPELDRVVLRDKMLERIFANSSSARKTAITTRIMQLVLELCSKQIHVTKRDLFYTDVKLFKQQGAPAAAPPSRPPPARGHESAAKSGESDDVLDDVACMVGCTRSSLNVVAAEKGIVVGRITFEDDGDTIDCTKMGVGGKAIPPSIDRVTNIRGDAEFILLIEKDAAFMRLAEDRFYNTYPCVIMTGKGQPDVATRIFLNKVRRSRSDLGEIGRRIDAPPTRAIHIGDRSQVRSALNIPILGLFDSDPYGLKILSVYMKGSKNMSYDSFNLTTPDIKWLGVRPTDLDKYSIPAQCRLEMTEQVC